MPPMPWARWWATRSASGSRHEAARFLDPALFVAGRLRPWGGRASGARVKRLTVLICTHDRAALLARALDSLQTARRPQGWAVDILVVANACTDDTHDLLNRIAQQTAADPGSLPVRWQVEPRPGKAVALNSAIPEVRTADLVAFVDDDQRVHEDYLVAACEAADRWPDFSLFCGRIVPDWDGTEPRWVHEEGRYRIRPRPVPQSGWGDQARELTEADPTPGGGMICVRGSVFQRVGGFAPDLGPVGHDLGGSEDADFIERALRAGERCFYVPEMLQYHHVDRARLRFGFVLRKAFQRARTEVLRKGVRSGISLYQVRKLVLYALAALWPPHPARFRYYLVRLAATLGEMAGQHQGRWRLDCRPAESRRTQRYLAALALVGVGGGVAGGFAAPQGLGDAAGGVVGAAAGLAALLALRAWQTYSLAGPRLPAEVVRKLRTPALVAFLRLVGFAFLLALVLAVPGAAALAALGWGDADAWAFGAAGLASIGLISALQFLRQLLFLPAAIVASYGYRPSRLYPLWERLTPKRLGAATVTLATLFAAPVAVAAWKASAAHAPAAAGGWLALLAFYGLLGLWLRPVEAVARPARRRGGPPNVLLIGSDTLRADRLDGRHFRPVAPFLAGYARGAAYFERCFTPCARTAPSLLALLTGRWPARLGIADNFVPDERLTLGEPALPERFRRQGYWTGAISDWCGADMGKFRLGFDRADVPPDQWNIFYLVRQGPKDLRLFLSLFARNAFGRRFLPEIYYLGGVPMTDELGREVRHTLSECAERDQPFFLSVFLSTTHGPFGSEYPYYLRYADRHYRGESKFAMARLTDPWEIIRRQAEPREAFDLDQIIALYDGCVTRLDDEIARIITHLERCGLAENTLVVVYSDHGMEFFEHGTWGQGNTVVSDASNHVPLLFKVPGRSGGRIPASVRLIDVAPTLMELCGIPGDGASGMDGQSLVPLLEHEAAPGEREIFVETGIWLTRLPGMRADHLLYPPLVELLTVRDYATGTISVKPEWEARVMAAKDRALRLGRWKLVCQPLEQGLWLQLFDVEADPECRQDLAARHPEQVRWLWARLQALAHWPLSDTPLVLPHSGWSAQV